ncbi:MAG TPA: 50S ribosomal protein L25 [Myxococcota bacterium]|nr:50S ribosomal protein L25 [Myxococcota bacterium]
MGNWALEVELREGTGKGVARKLRAAGRIPGVLYGRGEPPQSVVLDPRALERVITTSDAGMNTLIDLNIAGSRDRAERVVLVKELQRDPVRGAPLHVDFYQVDLTATIEVKVPIVLRGRPRGVELSGGILDQALRELDVECLPRAIPESITLDVSELEIGSSIHVRDLALPEGVVLRSDPDLSVASVITPKVEEEVAPVAAPVEGEAAAIPAEGAAAEGAAEKETEE